MKNKLIFIMCLAVLGISCAAGESFSNDSYSITASAAVTTITENLTLKEDMTVNGDLVLEKGEFNLNGHTLIVKGDFLQKGGSFCQSVAAGNLRVSGNYEITGDGSFEINNGSILDIDGNMIVNSVSDNTYWQNKGELRIGGNLEVYSPNAGAAFVPHSDAVVVFKGNKTHTLYFAENVNNYMEKVRVTDGGKLGLTGYCTGFVADSDMTLVDSLITGNRTFNLNGKTVTVDGDLTIAGTAEQEINIGGESTLIIYGNLLQKSGYLVQNYSHGNLRVGGNYEITVDGSFEVAHGSILDIDGDMIVDSISVNNTYWQNDGELRIGGDLEVYSPNAGAAFVPHVNAVVVFKGKNIHNVYFAENVHNYMEKVRVDDSGKIRLSGYCTGFVADSDMTLVDSIITGKRTLNLNGKTVTVDGDLTIAGTAEQEINIGGESTLIVNGDLLQKSGYLVQSASAGNLRVGGNYEITGNGSFEISNGSILDIDGDMIVNSISVDNTYWQNDGELRIGGDLEVYSPNAGAAFIPHHYAVVVFKGKNIHNVYFAENVNNYMEKVRVDDSGKIRLSGYCTGFVADSDMTLVDSLITGNRTFNLNGKTVTVDGDLTIAGTAEQEINIGGESTLIIYGNLLQKSGYLVQNYSHGNLRVGGNYEITGDGSFEVAHGSILDIDGDMIVDSISVNNTYWQNDGELRIGGNLDVYSPNAGLAFAPHYYAVVVFKGAKAHEVNIRGGNSFERLKIGIGDTVSFVGDINGIGSCKDIVCSVGPSEIASVSGAGITGKSVGEGELIFTGNGKNQTHVLIVDSANKGFLENKPSKVMGDVNADGIFNMADIVLLQKWLLASPDAKIADWKMGDFVADNRLDVFDFVAMKKEFMKLSRG